MTLALFDLDYTLLSGDSDHAWGHFLVERALVDPEAFAAGTDYYMAEYESGRLDIHEFLAFQLAPLAEIPREKLNRLREEFLEEKIRPMVTAAARALVSSHRERGDTLAIITATNDFITRPISRLFDIEHLIATELELANGAYTGAIVGEPCFREGKVSRLHAWLAQTGLSLKDSWFYTDSRNDLPLLEAVDHPVAVNPDAVLEAEAARRGWPVRRF
jgi:HAD superfamily hydrolase (TIGR01490 family)